MKNASQFIFEWFYKNESRSHFELRYMSESEVKKQILKLKKELGSGSIVRVYTIDDADFKNEWNENCVLVSDYADGSTRCISKSVLV